MNIKTINELKNNYNLIILVHSFITFQEILNSTNPADENKENDTVITQPGKNHKYFKVR